MSSAESSRRFLLYRILRYCSYALLAVAAVWMLGLVIMKPICAVPMIPFAFIVLYLIRKNFIDTLNHYIIPPYRSVSLWLWLLVVTEFICYIFIGGPEGTPWQLPWAKNPGFRTEGDTVQISNIRDFSYISPLDFDIRYLEESYDFNTLCELDLVLVQSGRRTLGMLSFGFEDGRYLVFSPEIRIPVGSSDALLTEAYKGLGRMYLFGTEEDLIGRYSEFGKADVAVFPLRATQPQMEQLLRLCINKASRVNSANEVPLPLPETYSSGLSSLVEQVFPEVGTWHPTSHRTLPVRLAANGLLLMHAGESSDAFFTRCTLQEAVAPRTPRAYSAELRRKLGLPAPAASPERNVQEEQITDRKADGFRSKRTTSSDLQATFSSAADVPEPGDRLSDEGKRDATPQLDRELPPPDVDKTDISQWTGTQDKQEQEKVAQASDETTAETSTTATQREAELETRVLTEAQQKQVTVYDNGTQPTVQKEEKPNATKAKAEDKAEQSTADVQQKEPQKGRRRPDWVAPTKKINPLDRKVEPKDTGDNPFGDKPLSL